MKDLTLSNTNLAHVWRKLKNLEILSITEYYLRLFYFEQIKAMTETFSKLRAVTALFRESMWSLYNNQLVVLLFVFDFS